MSKQIKMTRIRKDYDEIAERIEHKTVAKHNVKVKCERRKEKLVWLESASV